MKLKKPELCEALDNLMLECAYQVTEVAGEWSDRELDRLSPHRAKFIRRCRRTMLELLCQDDDGSPVLRG